MNIIDFIIGAASAIIIGCLIYTIRIMWKTFFDDFFRKSEWEKTRNYLGIESNTNEIWKLKHAVWDIEKTLKELKEENTTNLDKQRNENDTENN